MIGDPTCLILQIIIPPDVHNYSIVWWHRAHVKDNISETKTGGTYTQSSLLHLLGSEKEMVDHKINYEGLNS